MPACFAAAMAPLQHLEVLDCEGLPAAVLSALPRSLEAANFQLCGVVYTVSLSIAHLTGLQSLQVSIAEVDDSFELCALPASLTSLDVSGVLRAMTTAIELQLRQLVLHNVVYCVEFLQQLPETAGGLHELDMGEIDNTEPHVHDVVVAACACTGITRLQLCGSCWPDGVTFVNQSLLLDSLTRLPALQHLELRWLPPSRRDLLGCFTALTQLTGLDLHFIMEVDDMVVGVLAHHLTNLQYLSLTCYKFRSDGVWWALAGCNSLRKLCAHGFPAIGDEPLLCVSEDALWQLTTLTHLTDLCIAQHLLNELPTGVEQRFVDAMPGIRCITKAVN